MTDDDIVLLSGDLSWAMTMEDAIPDLEFLASLPGNKVILRGNHDYWWKSISALRSILPTKFFAVQNDCIRIGNYLICGTRGWTVPQRHKGEEDKKIYNREVERLKLSLNTLQKMRQPDDKVIAMAHYPPFDTNLHTTPFCDLYKEYDVSKVVYGHLHGKDVKMPRVVNILSVEYYLTSCDLVEHSMVQISD